MNFNSHLANQVKPNFSGDSEYFETFADFWEYCDQDEYKAAALIAAKNYIVDHPKCEREDELLLAELDDILYEKCQFGDVEISSMNLTIDSDVFDCLENLFDEDGMAL
jgi:hypothetical protein